jgi:hypothetical protein
MRWSSAELEIADARRDLRILEGSHRLFFLVSIVPRVRLENARQFDERYQLVREAKGRLA